VIAGAIDVLERFTCSLTSAGIRRRRPHQCCRRRFTDPRPPRPRTDIGRDRVRDPLGDGPGPSATARCQSISCRSRHQSNNGVRSISASAAQGARAPT
jgi:hypothetical protein